MLRTSTLLAAALLVTACGADGSADPAGGEQPPALGIRNLSKPLPNILCSGQPTEEQFDKLERAGVTHVLHLRTKGEQGTGWEEARANRADVLFERLEIAGADGLTRENVEAFAEKLAAYKGGTVLVSCGSSNRVGAMFALKAAWLDGASKEEAMALGKRAGMTRLASKVEALLDG